MHSYKQILTAINNNYAFAIWQKPHSTTVNTVCCKYTDIIKLHNYTDLDKYKGFAFAPFNLSADAPAFIIPDLECFDDIPTEQEIEDVSLRVGADNQSVKQEDYIQQCTSFIKFFDSEDVQKAVLAQCQNFTDYNFLQMPSLFNKLCEKYTDAFVYQLYIPNVGYWLGASPELLLHCDNNEAKTVSLAGTQRIKENEPVQWQQKEIEEQEIVTKHIRNVLHKFDVNNYTEDGANTVQAGQIAHLKTEFIFNSEQIKNRVGNFLSALHPTPAICGQPPQQALSLILNTESFNRTYYSGFMGELQLDNTIDLFVNLRCLQAFSKHICLYSGAGITKDSIPESEWYETQAKMQTLLNSVEY